MERQAAFDERRGVFMISVAAELAEMHPQTLRMYEARGLITPKRSAKNTRLYSFEDVERLRRIQRMTAEEGLNLAGVETVLDLERQLERTRARAQQDAQRADALESEMLAEIERVKRSFRAEIVPYGAYDAGEIVPAADDEAGQDPGRAAGPAVPRPALVGPPCLRIRDSSPCSPAGEPGRPGAGRAGAAPSRRPGDDEVVADLPQGERRLKERRSATPVHPAVGREPEEGREEGLHGLQAGPVLADHVKLLRPTVPEDVGDAHRHGDDLAGLSRPLGAIDPKDR